MVEDLDTILTDPDDISERYRVSNSILNNGLITGEELFFRHMEQQDSEWLVYYWIPEELALVREFVPTVYHKIAEQEQIAGYSAYIYTKDRATEIVKKAMQLRHPPFSIS